MRPLRYPLVLVALVLGAHAGDIWRLTGDRARDAGPRGGASGHNVILVVADGLRWQEVFRGADSSFIFGDPRPLGGDPAGVRARYWRPGVAERRSALMPFLWSTVSREGQLFGNRDGGSAARVTNAMWFSYPGYNEMLVGVPDPRIDRNTYGPNPNVTVFEWLNRREGFGGRVAIAGMWTTFRDIFNERRSRLDVHTHDNDAATYETAMRLLRDRRPRALFVGFGATDDVAHQGRYDLTLDAAHAVDRFAAQLWAAALAMPEYRGKTTMILVADHGRGRTARDWTDHGKDVAGSNEIWLAAVGPGVGAAGEHRGGREVTLAQVAATVAASVGLDYRGDVKRAAPPLALRVRR